MNVLVVIMISFSLNLGPVLTFAPSIRSMIRPSDLMMFSRLGFITVRLDRMVSSYLSKMRNAER